MDPLKELALDGPSKYWSEPPASRRRKATPSASAKSPTPSDATLRRSKSQSLRPRGAEDELSLDPDGSAGPKGKQSGMASQRKRAERGRGGGNGQEGNAEQSIWDGCQDSIKTILVLVERSEECKKEIFQMEAGFKERELLGSESPATLNAYVHDPHIYF
jgi:hypothetical protein